jgi:DNA-binding transcriptional regulator LsrR (DeoR family)
MLSWEERRQLVRVANLYYTDGWTQEQIAKKVGVSRPVISKMLQKAKDFGIVEVYIKDESALTVELEQKLEKKYGLTDVVVVPTLGFTPDMVKRSIGQAAAYYLSKNLKRDVKRLGISWGTTLSEVVKEYPYERREEINIVPLVGGMGTQHVEIHANQLAYELAKKMNGTCSYLYAPAIVETKELKERLEAMQDISAVLEEGKKVDVALIGIGNPYKGSTMKSIGYLQEEDLNQLRKIGAVGDISSRFFDELGMPVKHPINEKVIGLTLENLSELKVVIGVVEGTHKIESVTAALKGDYLDVLIIDEQTALALLQE